MEFKISPAELRALEQIVGKRKFYNMIKRCTDFLLALFLFISTLPIMLLISVSVRLDSRGPVIFKQKRVGKKEKIFDIYKFRSMYFDTPSYALSPEDNEHDFRITKCGAKLRATGLDELPQLLNVLKGEMSLVGPRPEMPFLVEEYKNILYFRTLVKPGLTGPWQLSPHRSAQIHEHPEFDYHYIQNQSITLDLYIILKTFWLTLSLLIFNKIKKRLTRTVRMLQKN